MVTGAALIPAASATAAVSQRPQPVKGPGGSQSAFGGVRVTTRGTSYNAWELLEPADPAPPSAPLVVVMHGYYDYSGYAQLDALARHLAAKGNIVIYPRWQTGVSTPCPGPFNDVPCITSAVKAIHSAIAFLHAHSGHVQPRLGEASYFGFSFGGILTINMINQYRTLDLPKPRAVFLDDRRRRPHRGQRTDRRPEPRWHPRHDQARLPHGGGRRDRSRHMRTPAATPCSPSSRNGSQGEQEHRPHQQRLPRTARLGGGPWRVRRSGVRVQRRHLRLGILLAELRRAARLRSVRHGLRVRPWRQPLQPLHRHLERRHPGHRAQGPGGRPDQTESRAAPAASPPPTPNAPPIATLGHIRGASSASHMRLTLHGTATGYNGAQFVQVAVVRIWGPHCLQMTAAGKFVSLRRCRRPS